MARPHQWPGIVDKGMHKTLGDILEQKKVVTQWILKERKGFNGQ